MRPDAEIVTSGTVRPLCSKPCCTPIVAAATDSPSTMIVKRPNRSAMWCGCHGVIRGRSAHSGTERSAAASTRKLQTSHPDGRARRDTHPICTTEMPTA